MRTTPAHLPQMRAHGLAIDDLPDEVLVYDLERHQAHCLNRSAALVWRSCNGRSSAAEIARRLTVEVDAPFTEDLVWVALSELEKRHLLEPASPMTAPVTALSRRQLVRRLGFAAAVAVPLITSIVRRRQSKRPPVSRAARPVVPPCSAAPCAIHWRPVDRSAPKTCAETCP